LFVRGGPPDGRRFAGGGIVDEVDVDFPAEFGGGEGAGTALVRTATDGFGGAGIGDFGSGFEAGTGEGEGAVEAAAIDQHEYDLEDQDLRVTRAECDSLVFFEAPVWPTSPFHFLTSSFARSPTSFDSFERSLLTVMPILVS